MLLSQDCTTRTNSLEIATFGIALLQFVTYFENTDKVEKLYTDEGNAVGKLNDLRRLRDAPAEKGPAFGYHTTRYHRIAKKNHIKGAKQKVKRSVVYILEGHWICGSVIGSAFACQDLKTIVWSKHAKIVLSWAIYLATRRNCPSLCISNLFQRNANQNFNSNNALYVRESARARETELGKNDCINKRKKERNDHR